MHRTLDEAEIKALLSKDDGGYVQDYYDDYDKSNWAETFPCSICGCCENPERCQWSVVCPRCGSGVRQYCTEPDGRITGIHTERYELALSLLKEVT